MDKGRIAGLIVVESDPVGEVIGTQKYPRYDDQAEKNEGNIFFVEYRVVEAIHVRIDEKRADLKVMSPTCR